MSTVVPHGGVRDSEGLEVKGEPVVKAFVPSVGISGCLLIGDPNPAPDRPNEEAPDSGCGHAGLL